MSCRVPETDDINFIMSVQHQLQATMDKRNIAKKEDRWSSAPKPRSPERWLNSVYDKSQIEPPRRPKKNHQDAGRWLVDSALSVNCKGQIDPHDCAMKNDADLLSHEDFRWKDCLCDKPYIMIQPRRRESIGILVDDFQDVQLSKNYHVSALSNHQDLSLSHRMPKIHAAMSA